MANEDIEELMMKSGFTSNDISLLRSLNKRDGTTFIDNMIDLEKRFYKLIVINALIFLGFAFLFLIAGEVSVIGFIIAIIITIPPTLFMLSFRLSYRAFIFMRKYKRE
ncbi:MULTISPECIES: hypothetical protein [Xenorhabdus]|uniref:hypothetical protein n=1 Tax=Xenorhabdus TaxID=626 RepID=UPI0006495812|nr:MULTISPECIES: hypothetical protein [Xenorhabdus]KLU17298.1 hypothetical protein AAY47_01235 [Xenorhabdus griffiniae]KOP33138.1 hypothetical protein AFK69_11215 [Xenorhabdus sp. GDc328]